MLVRKLRVEDFSRWKDLYIGYIEFYEMPHSAESLETTFAWLLDPDHIQEAVVVESEAVLIGLAHFQIQPNPIAGVNRAFLNDLFVAQDKRGSGCVELLMEALSRVAKSRDCASIRWHTKQDNHRARKVYDKYAEVTAFVTYQMDI